MYVELELSAVHLFLLEVIVDLHFVIFESFHFGFGEKLLVFVVNPRQVSPFLVVLVTHGVLDLFVLFVCFLLAGHIVVLDGLALFLFLFFGCFLTSDEVLFFFFKDALVRLHLLYGAGLSHLLSQLVCFWDVNRRQDGLLCFLRGSEWVARFAGFPRSHLLLYHCVNVVFREGVLNEAVKGPIELALEICDFAQAVTEGLRILAHFLVYSFV